MLDALSKIGSALGIPIFVFTVIIPIYNNKKAKKDEENKQVKNYVINKISELNNYFYGSNHNEDKEAKKMLLEILERVLKVKEVQLYYANTEDKRSIDMCFDDFENGQPDIKGPLNIKCNELGILITLSDKTLEKDKYRKYAIEHTKRLISLGGKKE